MDCNGGFHREKAPQGGSPTAATVVTVYTAFAKPQAGEGYTIDYINEKINIQAGYEISTWSDDFGFDKGVMTPDESGNVAIIPGKYYYVRKATKAVSDNAIPASAAMSFIKARPATPEQSELYSKSSYSITVKAESGQEYSIDDGATWVTDGSKGDRDSRKGTITFTGLTAGTTYYVVTRKTAVTTPGSEAFASEISMALSVTTDSGSSPSPTPGPEPTSAEEYTVPVGGDSSLKVEATIENGKAKVKEITKKDLEEFVEKVDGKTEIDSIELDFTQAKQEVKSVEFTKTTLENIQEVLESKENNISKLVVKMSEGTVSLDAKALEAVTEQAKGDTIILVVDKTQNEKLSEAKQETLKAYNVNKTFEAYFESNGQRIHDFKGGVATVSMKFEPTQGSNTKNYKIYYLDDNAKMHKYATKYENGMLVFATTHFSDYVIVYDGKTDVLLAQAKSSKGKIALSWNGLDNVTKYVVYGARCGHDYKKLTSTTGKSYTVKRASSQRLKAHKVYKFYVVAYDAVGNKISSRSIHCIYKNTNARFGNVKSIKAKISKLTLKVGDSKTVGAKYKMYAGKKHLKRTHGPALKFFSNNTDVAKVSENGKVTAVGAGTATIYIQDLGGKYTKTAVTVK